MTRQQSLKLAYQLDESARKKIGSQRAFEDALDDQLELALKRIELASPGLDAAKWLADEITDDPEHQVSPSTVYDMLGRRNGRRPCAEIIAAIYRRDEQFAAWWNAKLGYAAPERLSDLTPEQENALLRNALKEFGPAGEKKLREIPQAVREVEG